MNRGRKAVDPGMFVNMKGAAGRSGDSGKRDSKAGVEKMTKKKWRIKDGHGFVPGLKASLTQLSKLVCEVSTGTGGDYHRC